ncbi:MAG: hypothetical protein KatS3mg105_3073 [Gemmatales bacterium]|nr:MAG: hypothetical protein KatS3mg105_3073 [Gemmatales bacterium]
MRLAIGMISLAVVALASPVTQGAAKRSDAVVKATVKAGKIDNLGNQTVIVRLDIEKKWHVYANPVPADFPGIPTTITLAGTKESSVKVEYPRGKLVTDKFVGDYRVYEGQTEIPVTIRRQRGDKTPVVLQVKFQACSDRQCLLPVVVKLEVPAR